MLEGDGEATCIVPDGSNRPVISSHGALPFPSPQFLPDGRRQDRYRFAVQWRLRRLPTASSMAARPAMRFSARSRQSYVSGFRTKNIELNRTYGFVFLNVHSSDSAGWGLYLRDGFNNATQIISGEYSGNGIGGVYIGTDTIQLYFSSIAEGNVKYGIYYHGHLTGLQINDAYFEANGRNRTGWDVYGDFLDYDHPAIGVSIRNSLFNSLDAKSAAHIENTVDFDFSHNIGVPPLLGDPLLVNSVVLGKGVINPHIEGNTALPVVGGSGVPIHTAPANFAENLLLHSTALNAPAWKYKNTGEGCAGPSRRLQRRNAI